MRKRAHGAALVALALSVAWGCAGDGEKDTAAPADRAPAAPGGAAQGAVTFTALDVVDAQTAFAVGVDDSGRGAAIVLKTTDGGERWAAVLRVPGGDIQGLDFVDARHGVAVAEDGDVLVTADGGQTWTATLPSAVLTRRQGDDDEEYGPEINGLAFADPQNGVAVGGAYAGAHGVGPARAAVRPLVFQTANGGASWREVKLAADAPPAVLTRVYFADARHGWAVGGTTGDGQLGVLMRTIDGGATWQAVQTNIKQTLTDVFFADATTGWAVGEHELPSGDAGPSEVFATTDGGATWRSASKLPVSLYAVRFADARAGWAAGGGSKIFRTTDGGATWAEQGAIDLSTGQELALPSASGSDDISASALFTDFVLVAPGRGWAASDEGLFEYRGK